MKYSQSLNLASPIAINLVSQLAMMNGPKPTSKALNSFTEIQFWLLVQGCQFEALESKPEVEGRPPELCASPLTVENCLTAGQPFFLLSSLIKACGQWNDILSGSTGEEKVLGT